MMSKKIIALLLSLILLTGLLDGCSGSDTTVPPTEPAPPVTLRIAGGWTECRALDVVATAFNAEYPNCTIEYEYLQDYNESVVKRLNSEDSFDLFFTTNIQSDSEFLPYAADLMSYDELDLGDTFDGLIKNFMFCEESGAGSKLYAIPLGAEIRGLFVNKTLLNSLNIEMPTDQTSLLAACQTLKDNGYIPFQGNPSDFSKTLIYPWICNLIANADDPQAAHDKVSAREAGVSEMFREPCEFLYSLVEKDYYDYKTAQTDFNLFNDTTEESYANYFFNIEQNGEALEKKDDIGQVAFLPSPMSFKGVFDKTKENYHSQIDYEFVMAPISTDGGFAYMSPAHGIAAVKASPNIEWSIKFLNFLFKPENNETFAELFNVIPNTKESFSYVSTLFDVPDDHISHLGQVTFDYGFYDAVVPTLTDISKANNPKYMQDDGSGNLSLYPLDHFMQQMEENIKAQ